jgi:hypothetical protein
MVRAVSRGNGTEGKEDLFDSVTQGGQPRGGFALGYNYAVPPGLSGTATPLKSNVIMRACPAVRRSVRLAYLRLRCWI